MLNLYPQKDKLNLYPQKPSLYPKSPDLTTTEGLTRTATDVGLGKKAEEITKMRGEDPQKIFSGGAISDAFDLLNTLQYGVVGLVTGKGFVQGIKTRRSFTDKDIMGDAGVPGMIAGIAMDIAFDPLTYIAPWTALRKIPGFTKAGKALTTSLQKSRVGKSLSSSFAYRFGQDKVYKRIAERNIRNIARNNMRLLEIAKPLTSLDMETQKIVGIARRAGKLDELPKNILTKAKPAFIELEKFGKRAVKFGLLSKETYEAGIGKYMARLYRKYEDPDFVGKTTFVKAQGTPVYHGGAKIEDIKLGKGQYDKTFYLSDDPVSQLTEIWKKAQPTAKKIDPLIQEAKGETLEEFLKAQPKLYHGTTKKSALLIEKEGFILGGKTNLNTKYIGIDKKLLGDVAWFTDSPQKAKVFAGQSGRLKFLEEPGIVQISEKNLKLATPKDINAIIKGDTTKHYRQAIEDLKKQGFDGLQKTRADTMIWNVDKIKTKSQLTEIWKKAQGVELAGVGKHIAKIKGVISPKAKKVDISRFMKRKDIPEDIREAMGEIMEAGYPTAKSLVQLNTSIENVKFFNWVSKRFGSDVAREGFEKLPVTSRLFTTATGEKIKMFTKLKVLNRALKSPLKELKLTFKADKKVLSVIHSLEKSLDSLKGLRKEEFYKFWRAGEDKTRIISKARKLGTIPEHLIGVAEEMKKFKTYKMFNHSKLGIKVEKMEVNGILQRAGVGSRKEFFERVKQPFQKATKKVSTTEMKGNLALIVKAQKNIENIRRKVSKLNSIDKRSINDSFRFLEDTIQKITREKELISEKIGRVGLGELSGKYIPKAIFDDIQEITRPSLGLQGKIVGGFKFCKVILNPATHARNIISNMLLNSFEGLSPHRLDIYAKAAKQISTKGDMYKEAQKFGLGLNTFVAQELRGILTGPESAHLVKKYGRKLADKMSDMYQKEEEFAKMAQYIFQRGKGLSPEKAWIIAERATFNYAQVTPFIRKMRESIWGMPFITFTFLVTPQVVKTIAKHPTRISNIGKIKTGIESLSDLGELKRERASEPSWIRDGFYIKLPMKDKHGRSAYFDMTYIMPFGDLLSGNFFERSIKRETGLPESYAEAGIKKLPFINMIAELGKNQDFYGNKIWKESDDSFKQTKDLFRHLVKTYSPPLLGDQLSGGYRRSGEQRPGMLERLTKKPGIETGRAQGRTLMQELLRNVGLKSAPIDANMQETYAKYNQNNALRILLEESGTVKTYQRPYIPKQSNPLLDELK